MNVDEIVEDFNVALSVTEVQVSPDFSVHVVKLKQLMNSEQVLIGIAEDRADALTIARMNLEQLLQGVLVQECGPAPTEGIH